MARRCHWPRTKAETKDAASQSWAFDDDANESPAEDFCVNPELSQQSTLLIVRGLCVIFSYPLVMAVERDILLRFGERVRDLRTALDLSQEAFAALCDLDRTYIGGIERGERNLSLRNIEVIATALGISISKLTEGL